MTILKQKKFLLFIAILVTAAFFSLPHFSQARGLVPCGGYNADGSREAPCNVCDMFALIAIATNWMIGVAGIYAVYRLIFSGFNLVISLGYEEKITKNKESITNAIVGFVLVMIAFILVNTVVNYILLDGTPDSFKVQLSHPFTYLNPTSPMCK